MLWESKNLWSWNSKDFQQDIEWVRGKENVLNRKFVLCMCVVCMVGLNFKSTLLLMVSGIKIFITFNSVIESGKAFWFICLCSLNF